MSFQKVISYTEVRLWQITLFTPGGKRRRNPEKHRERVRERESRFEYNWSTDLTQETWRYLQTHRLAMLLSKYNTCIFRPDDQRGEHGDVPPFDGFIFEHSQDFTLQSQTLWRRGDIKWLLLIGEIHSGNYLLYLCINNCHWHTFSTGFYHSFIILTAGITLREKPMPNHDEVVCLMPSPPLQ